MERTQSSIRDQLVSANASAGFSAAFAGDNIGARHRPCCLRRGVRRLPFPCPRNMPRGWSAARRHICTLCEACASFGEGRCAPRRSIAVSSGSRAALSAAFPASPSALKPDPFRSIEPFGPQARGQHAPSASSWREVLLPPSGAPAPPGRGSCVSPARGHRASSRRRDASRRRPRLWMRRYDYKHRFLIRSSPRTVILRCEPTGPREARPDDRLREPRRMNGHNLQRLGRRPSRAAQRAATSG